MKPSGYSLIWPLRFKGQYPYQNADRTPSSPACIGIATFNNY